MTNLLVEDTALTDCPSCGCGGESCAADGCICCHQECVDHWYTVKDGTPAGFNDSQEEWWRQSATPLSFDVELPGAPIAPLTSFIEIIEHKIDALFVLPITGYASANAEKVGYMWVEFFNEAGTLVYYYAMLLDPKKLRLAYLPDQGWAVRLHDDVALWTEKKSYSWRFVAFHYGDDKVLVELTGKLEAS